MVNTFFGAAINVHMEKEAIRNIFSLKIENVLVLFPLYRQLLSCEVTIFLTNKGPKETTNSHIPVLYETRGALFQWPEAGPQVVY